MFSAARLRLTLWYLAILSVVVGLLSLVLYRILVSLRATELRAVGPAERSGIAQLFARDEGRLALQILALDAGIIILAALGAYFLAGRTLSPISRTMERQQWFVAAASHELRTPLTALRSSLEVTLLQPRAPEHYVQAISQAVGEAHRMGALVTDLLTLARFQRDAESLSLGLLDLRDVVRDVVEAVRPLPDQKTLGLKVQLDEPLLVVGDALKLREALTALVENAIAYTPAGGEIRIQGSVQRDQVTLQVGDSGPGMAPEHLPHIFEPFYRVDAARVGNGSHTGLGLALAAWIVRAHRGRLAVESRLGSGSVFTIFLPKAT